MSLFDDEPKKIDEKQDNSVKNNLHRTESSIVVKKSNSRSIKAREIKDDEIVFVPKREIKEIKAFKKIGELLLRYFKENKLHHTLMFSGDYGIGKATFAYWLIAEIIVSLNKEQKDMHLELLRNNIHPDVFFLEEGENEIKIEQIRKFLAKITFKSTYGYKFAIIDDINSINSNGVNALLKTLEEPPDNTFFFIINHKISKILDTIFSRCNEIKMNFSNNECVEVLRHMHNNWNNDDIAFYSMISGNSVHFANILADINVKKMIHNDIYDQSFDNLPYLLTEIYNLIDMHCKNLSKTLKISLLERVLMYVIQNNIEKFAKDNNSDKRNVVVIKSLIKQFTEIKKFELPVRFV